MRIITTILAFAVLVNLSGCASVAGDNCRTVRVTSKPAGAHIYVDNQHYGVTPALVSLPNYIYGGKGITVKKPGFQEQTAMVNTKFQPVALLNILFWPGFIIDAATGSLIKIDPKDLNMHYQLERA